MNCCTPLAKIAWRYQQKEHFRNQDVLIAQVDFLPVASEMAFKPCSYPLDAQEFPHQHVSLAETRDSLGIVGCLAVAAPEYSCDSTCDALKHISISHVQKVEADRALTVAVGKFFRIQGVVSSDKGKRLFSLHLLCELHQFVPPEVTLSKRTVFHLHCSQCSHQSSIAVPVPL